MTDPKLKRLTSERLTHIAEDPPGYGIERLVSLLLRNVSAIALHLAAVEAEREVSETGHHNIAAHTESGLRTERDALKSQCERLRSERDHYRKRVLELEQRCAACYIDNGGRRDDGAASEKSGRAPSAMQAERDRMRAHLDRIEGALTDAESVPVHSDELWESVQKLKEERDEWRGRAECARDQALEESLARKARPGDAVSFDAQDAARATLRAAQDDGNVWTPDQAADFARFIEPHLQDAFERGRMHEALLAAKPIIEAAAATPPAQFEADLAEARDQALEDAARECVGDWTETSGFVRSAGMICAARIRALKGGAK